MRLFVQIVVAGSLSEAARRENMSLTAVSRRLAALELRLQVRLIDRASRRFELTDEGRFLYARARRLVDELDTTLAELDSASRVVRGRLRVSAPNEIGRRIIAPLSREFANDYPDVVVDLSFTDMRPDVLADDLDVAIVTQLPKDGDVIHRKLLDSRRVVCAAPAYIAEFGIPETPEDLAGHRCIVTRRGTRIYDSWRLQGPDGMREYPVSPRLVSDSTDTIHQWVLAGGGIAVKALWDIKDDLREGRLVELIPGHARDDICLYATHATRRLVPPRIRLFIDRLVERMPLL